MPPKPSKVVDLKLFNIIIQHDVYVVAHSVEEAYAAIEGVIREGEAPMEKIHHEVRALRDVRTEWKTEKPFVASAVTDEEWAPFSGKTTEEFFEAVLQIPTKN